MQVGSLTLRRAQDDIFGNKTIDNVGTMKYFW